MAEKTRYSDEELQEFKEIIDEKMAVAKHDYQQMMRTLMNADGNDVDDTSPTYKVLEEGSATQTKEELMTQAARLQKFIQGLEAALVRIQNKTYGIDRITGELIPKERLRAVPHATLSVQSKSSRFGSRPICRFMTPLRLPRGSKSISLRIMEWLSV